MANLNTGDASSPEPDNDAGVRQSIERTTGATPNQPETSRRRARFSLVEEEEDHVAWNKETMERIFKDKQLFGAVEELIFKLNATLIKLDDQDRAVDTLKDRVRALKQGIMDLETQVVERDGTIKYLENRAASATSGIGGNDHYRKTTKQLDPEKFTGAITGTSSYLQWYTEMVGKCHDPT